MAAKKKAKKTRRGRVQDRAKVAAGQDYEVAYTAKKTGRSTKSVKKAIKRVGKAARRSRKL
jgi:hypothetical protein